MSDDPKKPRPDMRGGPKRARPQHGSLLRRHVKYTPRERPDARRVAFDTLERIEGDEAYLQLALEGLANDAELDPRDRGLALQIVMGVSRLRASLDHELGAVARKGLESISKPVLTAMRMGLYQVRHLDRVPDHAAVNAAVDHARRAGGEGAARLTNGMLRALLRKPVPLPMGNDAKSLGVRLSHPQWLVERWIKAEGLDGAIARCEANNRPSPLTVRVDRLDTDRTALTEQIAQEGGVLTPTAAPHGGQLSELPAPFSSASFKAGWWVAQDEASQLVVRLLDPQAGDTVWDVCAAPGGKTRYIAWLMGDRGRILATDVNPGRAKALRRTVSHLESVSVQVHDGSKPMGGPPPFDRVLVDAPCTALGLLRRHPEIRWRRSGHDVRRNTLLQREVLEGAAAGVKVGGTLVYSVCSDAPEEGPDVVTAFLEDHPEFHLVPVTAETVGGAHRVSGGFMRCGPHIGGADGFFAARLERVS